MSFGTTLGGGKALSVCYACGRVHLTSAVDLIMTRGGGGSPKNPIILRSLKRNCVNPSAISSSAHIQAEQLMLHLMNQK